jgi:hypothetical protein
MEDGFIRLNVDFTAASGWLHRLVRPLQVQETSSLIQAYVSPTARTVPRNRPPRAENCATVRTSPKSQADVHTRYSHDNGRKKKPYRMAINQFVGRSLGMGKSEEHCTDDEQEATASDEEPDLSRQSAQIRSHKYESRSEHWQKVTA